MNTRMLTLASLLLIGATLPTAAQQTTADCKAAAVIPGKEQAAAKIIVDAPLPEPLARQVAVFQYCALNLRILPVFGQNAVSVNPRLGHLHVTLDGAPWHWVEASGNPIIVAGIAPGKHTLLVELADPNHQVIDKTTVTFVMPQAPAAKAQ